MIILISSFVNYWASLAEIQVLLKNWLPENFDEIPIQSLPPLSCLPDTQTNSGLVQLVPSFEAEWSLLSCLCNNTVAESVWSIDFFWDVCCANYTLEKRCLRLLDRILCLGTQNAKDANKKWIQLCCFSKSRVLLFWS